MRVPSWPPKSRLRSPGLHLGIVLLCVRFFRTPSASLWFHLTVQLLSGSFPLILVRIFSLSFSKRWISNVKLNRRCMRYQLLLGKSTYQTRSNVLNKQARKTEKYQVLVICCSASESLVALRSQKRSPVF